MLGKKPVRDGRNALKPSKPRLDRRAKPSRRELERLLTKVFAEFRESSQVRAKYGWEFVFHMTDWLSDLERLASMYKSPSRVDVETAGEIVAGFLYHAVPHLSAAGRLLLEEIPDAFAGMYKSIDQEG